MSKISAYYICDPIFRQKVQDRCFHMKGLSHVFRGCINFRYSSISKDELMARIGGTPVGKVVSYAQIIRVRNNLVCLEFRITSSEFSCSTSARLFLLADTDNMW